MQLHWFEAKQLDRVTNFSTEIEILKRGNELKIHTRYYCTFRKEKKQFEVENVCYLGFFKNRYIKAVEFKLLVILKSLQLILKNNDCVIMVNQDLIKHALPSYFINKLFKKKNKFIVDIRTTPTNPDSFQKDMNVFHGKFRRAVRYFDGLSFITPFMEKYTMESYNRQVPTLNWSSGVDQDLFDFRNYEQPKNKDTFTVFYHGGISESRGNLTLIKACELVKSKGYSIELIQIGICVDATIPKYINDSGLEGWCKLQAPVPLHEIPQLVAKSDLPVLPFPNFMAWRVSSPIKLMEYLSMGKKVLAPNMEAFTDVFKSNDDLIFYFDTNAENQIEEIAKQIIDIIDVEALKTVDKSNLFKFVEQYSWKNQADKLFDFCEKL